MRYVYDCYSLSNQFIYEFSTSFVEDSIIPEFNLKVNLIQQDDINLNENATNNNFLHSIKFIQFIQTNVQTVSNNIDAHNQCCNSV